jgi:hypothetical protein
MNFYDSDEADGAKTKATYESVQSRTISGDFVYTGFCDEDPDAEAHKEYEAEVQAQDERTVVPVPQRLSMIPEYVDEIIL